MNWKLNSHETIKVYFKKERFNKDSKILIIDTSDYVSLFDLAEEVFDGKILVLTNYIKDIREKVKEFGFKRHFFQ